MLTKADLPDLIIEALKAKNGSAKIIDVCKFVWKNHNEQLESSGDLFLLGNMIFVGELPIYGKSER